MSETPERIWANLDHWVRRKPSRSGYTEYVRADVANARIRELESALNRVSADAAWTPKHPACEKILETAAAVLTKQS